MNSLKKAVGWVMLGVSYIAVWFLVAPIFLIGTLGWVGSTALESAFTWALKITGKLPE